jgi:hypothetical protein
VVSMCILYRMAWPLLCNMVYSDFDLVFNIQFVHEGGCGVGSS